MKSAKISIALTVIFCVVTQLPAFGENDKPRWYSDRFTYFYRDPRLEHLVGLIERWQSDAGNRWDSYPPLVGFLAVVFRSHPSWIEKLIPSTLTPDSATALSGALRLAGDPSIPEELRTRIVQAGSDPILKRQLAGLPNDLDNLNITLPTHLDILWGASFASGDSRYALKIIGFLEKIAGQSNQAVLDIVTVARKYPETRREALMGLRRKYGDRGFVQIVFAATALWGIVSNAEQHNFIKKAVVIYTSEHMDSSAAHAIILDFPQMLYFLGEGRQQLLRNQ